MLKKWLDRLEEHKRSFRLYLTAAEGLALDRLRPRAFDLAACLGLVIIPSVAFAGDWNLAADEAVDFLRLLRSSLGRCPDRTRSYLHLLAAPILWALLFAGLDAFPAGGSQSQPFRKACSVPRLFTALDRLPGSPPSVCFAAGILATLTAPPTAAIWIERAHWQARCHGARAFAAFFSRLVADV